MNTNYILSRADAQFLIDLLSLPLDEQEKELNNKARNNVYRLFLQFIALTHSVMRNNFEVVKSDIDPAMHNRISLPTIFGALNGIVLANGIDPSTLCPTCAYRIGTPANQTLPVAIDAMWCASKLDEPFYCHADKSPEGYPTKACAGYAQRKRKIWPIETENAENHCRKKRAE